MNQRERPEGKNPGKEAGLYDPVFEHDACGIGFVADRAGRASAEVLTLALQALARLAHRGAVDADGRTGDGAGSGRRFRTRFWRTSSAERGACLPEPGRHAVGLLFLPAREDERRVCREAVEGVLRAMGLPLLAWRKVPFREEVLGQKARGSRPAIVQLMVGRPAAFRIRRTRVGSFSPARRWSVGSGCFRPTASAWSL